MRTAIAIALIASLYACAVSAQAGGHIGLYSDSPGYSDYCLSEWLSEINRVYIVHNTAVEGTGVRFKLSVPWPGFSPMIDYGSNLVTGDGFTGVEVGFAGCRPLPYLIGVIEWVPLTPTACGAIDVVPDPASPSGMIEVLDCSDRTLAATGGTLVVNAEFCGTHFVWWCPPVDVEKSTWSRIKALYGN